jgi:hypothetical protein
MAAAEVQVKVADLPQVKAAFAEAAELVCSLRDLLQVWEPRVRCPQCGQRYAAWACGPTHASVAHLVRGDGEFRDVTPGLDDPPGGQT